MELSEEQRIKIEKELYTEVMLLIESKYNIECVIDSNKNGSTKIIFKDRKTAIQNVVQSIKKFAQENGLDINSVKNYLLNIMENKRENNKLFNEEYEEAKAIILIDEHTEER